MNNEPVVSIVMGSQSDLETLQQAGDLLKVFGVRSKKPTAPYQPEPRRRADPADREWMPPFHAASNPKSGNE
jgi:hypothetical protein